jgi:hypothetical protein
MDTVGDVRQSFDYFTRYGRMLITNSNNLVHSISLESTVRTLFAQAKTPRSEIFRANILCPPLIFSSPSHPPSSLPTCMAHVVKKYNVATHTAGL